MNLSIFVRYSITYAEEYLKNNRIYTYKNSLKKFIGGVFVKIKKPKLEWMLTLVAVMLGVIYFLVWYSGGTSNALPHLFYIPIILAALVCSWKCSLATALISGILLSEWLMPLSREPLVYQNTSSWVIRLIVYVVISLWTSLVFGIYRRRAENYQEQISEFAQLHQASLHALVDLAEMHDHEVTGRHLNRLKHYANLITAYLGIDKELSKNIADTISLHDIGKVAVSDIILNKPGPLTAEEFEIIKKHPVHGTQILKAIESEVDITNPAVRRFLKTAMEIVLYHHEKWDGTGYPVGLKGKSIPISARIAALCDVYDSLRSERPYKEPYSHEKAVAIIIAESGSHFDPKIVRAFKALSEQFNQVWDQLQAIPAVKNIEEIPNLADLIQDM